MSAFSTCVTQLSALHEALRAERDALAHENANLRAQLQTNRNADVDGSETLNDTKHAHFKGKINIEHDDHITSVVLCERRNGPVNAVDVGHPSELRNGPVNAAHVGHPTGNDEEDQSQQEMIFQSVTSLDSALLSLASQGTAGSAFHWSHSVTSSLSNFDKVAERMAQEMQHMFTTICKGRGGVVGSSTMFNLKWRKLFLTPRDIADMRIAQSVQIGKSTSAKKIVSSSSFGRRWGLKPILSRSYSFLHARYASAITALNDALQAESPGFQVPSAAMLPFRSSAYLSFEGFSALMTKTESELHELIGPDHQNEIVEIRNTLIKAGTVGLIAEAARVDQRDLMSEDEKSQNFHCSEAIVSIMIVLNAILMGVSLDVDNLWVGWKYIEWFFTLFFFLEMLFKIVHSSVGRGCRGGLRWHFFGPDMFWNLFDATIVFFAVTDLIFTIALNDPSQLSNLTIVRLARLARLSRLLRVLRLRMFKTLLLLISGAVNGMRILFFALLFLWFVVYCCALLLRFFLWDRMRDLECLQPQALTCSPGQIVLSREKRLFASTTQSMFLVYRCVIGDCQSSKGEPLGAILVEEYGWLFAIPYVLCLLFFQFGLFNLIMAIFVENTLEYAKFDETRRRELQHVEHVRSARTLQALVLKFVVEADAHERSSHEGFATRLHQFFAESNGTGNTQQLLNVKVTPEVFCKVLDDKSVQKLMDELDISMSSRRKLFEALDADGNGTLSVQELIDGIMKLRGPADKTDIIGMSLVIRSMQHTVNKLEAGFAHERKRTKRLTKETSGTLARPEELELSLLQLPQEDTPGELAESSDAMASSAPQDTPSAYVVTEEVAPSDGPLKMSF